MIIEEFRRTHLPYCIARPEKGSYVILNRNYKPLGFTTHDFVDYDKYPIQVNYRISKIMAAKLSWDGKGFEECEALWLYNDSCIPTSHKRHMDIYLKKIAILAKLKTRA